ncbi:peroxisomal ATPase PEX6-like isoform X2 [Penaeus indicus]|uniref:peroxisomal ATPase PEX6-like isoform X2 n=1 Tax=Penaeus indicus TaxID=29960 RepID=UPI00300C7988
MIIMAEHQEHCKIYQYVKLLIYTASLIKIIRPHISDPITYAVKKTTRGKLRLSVQRISLKKLNTLLTSSPGFEPDLNADVFISERKAIYYGVQNGEWYHVFFFGSMCMKTPNLQVIKRRWIRVHIHSDIDDDHCLLSPILFYNLQNGNHNQVWNLEFDDSISSILFSDHVKRVLTLWKEAYAVRESEKVTMVQSSPATATEVHVQIVESPDYKCGSELEVLLSDAFRVPKLAAVEDILGLPVPNHLGYEFSTGTSIIPPKYIFIRISVLQKDHGSKTKESLLISTETANLYLVGTTHSYLPPLCKSFDRGGTVDVPPVLKRTFSNVTNILQSELRERKQEVLSGKRDLSENVKKKKSRMQKDSFGNLEREHRAGGANILMLGATGSGSEQIIELSASSLNLSVVWADCWHLKGDTSGGTEARLRQIFSKGAGQAPCVLALTSVHAISKDRDGGEDARVVAALKEEVAKLPDLQPPVFLIGTAPHRTQVSEDLWSIWSHQECIDIPELGERRQMLEWLLSKRLQQHQFLTLAQRTAGFVFGDLQALLCAAQRYCVDRLETSEDKLTTQEKQENDAERCSTLMYGDVMKALDELQSSRSEALGAPRIPQVKWNEVGGLEEAKRQVINTIQLPLRHPSLVSNKLRRSGVLLYGPPGTGKTLLAKAVATECGLNFLSVKGPELLNMYVGQSEENVRQVFSKARAAAPCIIFFDELDSLAPNRGRSGDSGGVMDRIVSALLAELDGVSSSADVFVLAATNRPDLIDPALLRPGRFEKLVFLGVCEDRAGQIKILQAVTSKIPLGADVSLEQVAELLPLTLTGADLYALCADALYNALHRITCKIAAGEINKDEASVSVEEEDLSLAASHLIPSVTPSELAHYKALSTTKQR